MRLGLRNRILLWYALTIPAIILALALAAQQVMVARLGDALDDRLQERAEAVAKAITTTPGTTPQTYDALVEWLTEQQLPYVPAVLRLSDSERNVVADFGEIPEPLLPLLDRQLFLPPLEQGRYETIRLRGHDALRLFTLPVKDPSTGQMIAVVQTGDSLAQVVAARKQLWKYALLVGAPGSVLAVMIAWLTLRRGLRPLDTMLAHIRRIGGSTPGARLPQESRPPELEQLAQGVNAMLERLDAASRSREMFVAGVSHDLRTPLTALQGHIDVLRMEPEGSRQVVPTMEQMSREVRRLIRMSENLLLDIQLESRPALKLAQLDLRGLVDEVSSDMAVLARALDFHISGPQVLVVAGDYDLLKQALVNLLDNAFKFTAKGGTVEVRIRTDGDRAALEVSDTGRGIQAEHLQRIFDPYYRVEGSRTQGGGMGLGLTIVRRIVSLHNGEIQVRSEPGKGTTLTVYLPLASDPESGPATPHNRS
jgi:signal transduction histidine kinase